jgi:hypothetical protein
MYGELANAVGAIVIPDMKLGLPSPVPGPDAGPGPNPG